MTHPHWLDRLLPAMAVVVLAAVAAGQPPEGGPPEHGPGRPPHDPLRAALDADGDHELSADEIKDASTAVAKLDRDGDGRVDREEFRPPLPPGPPGPGFEGRRPPRGEFPSGRPPRGERPEGRPPREFGGPRGPRPEGGAPGGPSPERFIERAMTFDADGDGRLDRAEMEMFAAEIQKRMQGGRGPGGPPEGGRRPD